MPTQKEGDDSVINDVLERFVKPIPIMQWLVVVVLCAHVVTSHTILDAEEAAWFLLILMGGNLLLLQALPRLLSPSAIPATLVIVDTLLVPATLYVTGTTGTDIFIVYFGIIMIAGAAGNLRRALMLASVTCVAYLAYGGFLYVTQQETIPLGTLLLRLPFLLVMTLFYGALAEFAQQERSHRERLVHDALHDELTGMPNRRHLLDTLARMLEECKRFESPLSCAVIDVDHFKDINDSYGHDMGDLVLRDYASILGVQSRGYDLGGRLGGDEFVWILPRVEKDGALAAAERLREAVEQHQFGSNKTAFRLTTSIGLTTYLPSKTEQPTPAQMLKVADLALYTAKREGRNRVSHLPLLDAPAAATHEPAPAQHP
jgi:diguanylate cyclase (GGDEF)-like protein